MQGNSKVKEVRNDTHLIDDAFGVWAFGIEVWNKYVVYENDAIDLLHAWNLLHSDDLLLSEDDIVQNSVEEMQYLYKEYLDEEKTKRDRTSEADKPLRADTKGRPGRRVSGSMRSNLQRRNYECTPQSSGRKDADSTSRRKAKSTSKKAT